MARRKKTFNISSQIEPRNILDISAKTGNLYESLIIISKRARQIASQQKEELHAKLDEFASTTDTLEEIHENKEQIEISKYYERMPHPTLLAFEEFMDDKLHYRKPDDTPPTIIKNKDLLQ